MKRSVRWLVLGVLMVSVAVLSLSTTSSAQIGIGISVRVGPPALPVYAQPMCPGAGYHWIPGYWAWNDDDGYYWVPGTWVVAPVGMLWTPGYWGWGGGFYAWHSGYWGRHVGFYGGIDYGFGYGGVGFGGGEWRGDTFFYNRSVMNVTNVTNVYNRTVIVNNTRNVSFNGPGGIEARPTREEEAYGHESHRAALSTQMEHEHAASQNRQLFASENHGRPAVAATGRPGEFSGHNVERAKAAGEPYHAPRISPQAARVSEGNRGSNQSGRNAGNVARNSERNSERNAGRNSEMRNNQPGNRGQVVSRENSNATKQERASQQQERKAQNPQRQARNSEMRNNQPGNRGQMASREPSNATRQERAVQQQERNAQNQQRQSQRQAQAEQKRREPHPQMQR